MKEIETALKEAGFSIEYIGEQNPCMYSFIAHTERHCIVATIFEAHNRQEQCACATFNPTFLAEIKSRYGKFEQPGFEAYIDVGSKTAIPDVPGPHNHDHSVYEIQRWLSREYSNTYKADKTTMFT